MAVIVNKLVVIVFKLIVIVSKWKDISQSQIMLQILKQSLPKPSILKEFIVNNKQHIKQLKMSKLLLKWKQISESPQRFNKMLGDINSIPQKYHPKRDKSLDCDPLFNKSRSKYYSSFQNSISLNKSKDQDLKISNKTFEKSIQIEVQSKDIPISKIQDHSKIDKIDKGELLISLDSMNKVSPKEMSILKSLRKQYLVFKEHMLSQLEKQKEMVQKMVKEIIITLEYELEKLSKVSGKHEETEASTITLKNKSIDDWKKQYTNKVSLALEDQKQTPKKNIDFRTNKYALSKNTSSSYIKDHFAIPEKDFQPKVIKPLSSVFEMKNYLEAFTQLKNQIHSMDVILLGSGKPEKTKLKNEKTNAVTPKKQ